MTLRHSVPIRLVLPQAVRRTVGILVAVLLLAVPAAAVGADADGTGAQTLVPVRSIAWQDRSGTWQHGHAAIAAVEAFLERRAHQRERSCAALVEQLEERIDGRLELLFDRLADRVPDFADWVFDWETSYARYFDVIKFTGAHLLENLQNYELSVDFDRVRTWIADQLLANFSAIVVHPVETEAALAGLKAELASMVTAELAAQRAEERQRLDSFLAAEVPDGKPMPDSPTPRAPRSPAGLMVIGALDAPQRPDPYAFRASLPTVETVFVLEDDLTESMLMRTPRPVLARFMGLGIRVAAGISVWRIAGEVADITDLGIYGYVPGLMLGIGIAIATAWTVDYGITRADEILNRRQYEDRMRVLLDRLEGELQSFWVRGARQTVLPDCLGRESMALSP